MWSLFRALRKPQLSALRFLAEKSVGSPPPLGTLRSKTRLDPSARSHEKTGFHLRSWDDRIFIPSWTSIKNQNSRSSTLGVYDISSRALETVELKKPILETIPTDDGLIIIHGDIHQTSSTRTQAALLDYETWIVKSEGALPYHAVQAEILNNELCVLDSSDRLHLVSLDGRWSEHLSLAFTPSLDDSHISSFVAV